MTSKLERELGVNIPLEFGDGDPVTPAEARVAEALTKLEAAAEALTKLEAAAEAFVRATRKGRRARSTVAAAKRALAAAIEADCRGAEGADPVPDAGPSEAFGLLPIGSRFVFKGKTYVKRVDDWALELKSGVPVWISLGTVVMRVT